MVVIDLFLCIYLVIIYIYIRIESIYVIFNFNPSRIYTSFLKTLVAMLAIYIVFLSKVESCVLIWERDIEELRKVLHFLTYFGSLPYCVFLGKLVYKQYVQLYTIKETIHLDNWKVFPKSLRLTEIFTADESQSNA